MTETRVLISDLDDTLLGDRGALARFARWMESRQETLRLVYSSGRFFEAVDDLVESTTLPAPEAVIGGAGTEIHFYPDGATLEGWPPGGDRWEAQRVREVLAGSDRLKLRPAEFQGRYKISFLAHGLEPAFLDQLRDRLHAEGQDVEVVYGSGGELDLLPKGVNRGRAAEFLALQWRLDHRRVIVAGGTGNDLPMFRCGFPGIVVANAPPELTSLDQPDVYHSGQARADGVVDGMEYWLRRLEG